MPSAGNRAARRRCSPSSRSRAVRTPASTPPWPPSRPSWPGPISSAPAGWSSGRRSPSRPPCWSATPRTRSRTPSARPAWAATGATPSAPSRPAPTSTRSCTGHCPASPDGPGARGCSPAPPARRAPSRLPPSRHRTLPPADTAPPHARPPDRRPHRRPATYALPPDARQGVHRQYRGRGGVRDRGLRSPGIPAGPAALVPRRQATRRAAQGCGAGRRSPVARGSGKAPRTACRRRSHLPKRPRSHPAPPLRAQPGPFRVPGGQPAAFQMDAEEQARAEGDERGGGARQAAEKGGPQGGLTWRDGIGDEVAAAIGPDGGPGAGRAAGRHPDPAGAGRAVGRRPADLGPDPFAGQRVPVRRGHPGGLRDQVRDGRVPARALVGQSVRQRAGHHVPGERPGQHGEQPDAQHHPALHDVRPAPERVAPPAPQPHPRTAQRRPPPRTRRPAGPPARDKPSLRRSHEAPDTRRHMRQRNRRLSVRGRRHPL
ncbi:exported hypothetical protein [Streptomyces misionensis JCM 4497]